MRCSSRNCECNKCADCGHSLVGCLCDLLTRTNTLLDKSEYTYEDFAHSARYLLEEWVNATKA